MTSLVLDKHFCCSQKELVKYEKSHSRLFGVTWQPHVTFTTTTAAWRLWSPYAQVEFCIQLSQRDSLLKNKIKRDIEATCKSNPQQCLVE